MVSSYDITQTHKKNKMLRKQQCFFLQKQTVHTGSMHAADARECPAQTIHLYAVRHSFAANCRFSAVHHDLLEAYRADRIFSHNSASNNCHGKDEQDLDPICLQRNVSLVGPRMRTVTLKCNRLSIIKMLQRQCFAIHESPARLLTKVESMNFEPIRRRV